MFEIFCKFLKNYFQHFRLKIFYAILVFIFLEYNKYNKFRCSCSEILTNFESMILYLGSI